MIFVWLVEFQLLSSDFRWFSSISGMSLQYFPIKGWDFPICPIVSIYPVKVELCPSFARVKTQGFRVFPGVVEEVRSELDSYHGRHSSHWIPHDGGETHRHPSGQHGGLRRHRSSWNFMKRWRDLWGFGILCWLVVWNMNFMFPYIGNNTPNWRTHIFRGVGIPPTSLCIYNYRGEAGDSPEDVGTFSLPLIDICIFGRSCIQMGEGGGLLTFIALRHQKMLLRSRCCYVEDAVTLKMLLRPRCCYVEDDVTLRMLLRSRCCYVEDVVMFKMFFFTLVCVIFVG